MMRIEFSGELCYLCKKSVEERMNENVKRIKFKIKQSFIT